MDANKYLKLWEQDAPIDETELSKESRNIPQLHAKYLKHYSTERRELFQLQREYKVIKREQYEYYTGRMPTQRLNELGLKPFPHKVLKNDLERYLQSDQRITDAKTKIEEQENTIEVLQSIIDQINKRGFQIKNSLDWLRFTNGSLM